MHEAIEQMLSKYKCERLEDSLNALREIMQQIALLGLWRSKFFEHAAFYGGTALRIHYGLDRFSEDLDFSLLTPDTEFDLQIYTNTLMKELSAFGFDVYVDSKIKTVQGPVQSAFLKANTINQLLVIETAKPFIRQIPKNQLLKIKIEIDTDPPAKFSTESKYLLMPVPFPVRVVKPEDLFAGKMHAVLCRKWKNRVKGRDWYDLVWFITHHPHLHLIHLQKRMQQTGHWPLNDILSESDFRDLLKQRINGLDINLARKEAEPFVKNSETLSIWSHDFFNDIAKRIVVQSYG